MVRGEHIHIRALIQRGSFGNLFVQERLDGFEYVLSKQARPFCCGMRTIWLDHAVDTDHALKKEGDERNVVFAGQIAVQIVNLETVIRTSRWSALPFPARTTLTFFD